MLLNDPCAEQMHMYELQTVDTDCTFKARYKFNKRGKADS